MKIELCDIDSCTQCGACVQACPRQCISMKEARDGFRLPSIDTTACIECGRCMRACHKITPGFDFSTPRKNYACWTTSMSDRLNSSSGGAFPAIARRVLYHGGVVFGASMCSDLKVRHIAVGDEADLIRIQGSKYVQSDVGRTFIEAKELLDNGTAVLYSGTPCQIAALLTFLPKCYDNLYTVDIVCHGVPSQKSFDIYASRTGIAATSCDFRFRFTEGWGFRLSRQPVASAPDKVPAPKRIPPSRAYYLKAFTSGLMFGESCYTCPYARVERVSDITLADYWGLGTMGPFKHPTTHGISCMLVNTDKGERLLTACNNLEREERPLEEAVRGNHNLSHVSQRPAGRDTYCDDAATMPLKQLRRKYRLSPSWRDYLRIIKQAIVKLNTPTPKPYPSMTEKPFFSIVVPVYNVEKYLRQCVDSLLKQDYDNFEIILVDDGSPDSCPDICDEYAGSNERVKTVHKTNGGLSDARNAGIREARGRYVTFVDSDDFWRDSDVLSGVKRVIDSNGNPDIVVSDFIKYHEAGNRYFLPKVTCDSTFNGKEKAEILAYLYFRHADLKISACQKFVRNDLLAHAAFEKGLLSEDIDWSLSLYPQAKSIALYDRPYYCYRQQRKGSITNTASTRSFASIMYIIEKWSDAIPHLDIPDMEKAIYMGYLAYQLSITMLIYARLPADEKPAALDRIRHHRRLFDGLLNWKTMRVNTAITLLGIRNTCRLLSAFVRLRTAMHRRKIYLRNAHITSNHIE